MAANTTTEVITTILIFVARSNESYYLLDGSRRPNAGLVYSS